MSLKIFSPLECFGKFEKDMCYFFFESLVKFTYEAVWSTTFVSWEFFDYYFNFITRPQSIKIFCFSPGGYHF